jgi:transcriptional regulator with XRE-family HTH domain
VTTDPPARALGRKIAFHRTRRGLSQRDFGAMVDRSETWVSQVERGIRHIDRMTVLRQVAEALEVPLAELAADTPIVAEASSRPAPAAELRMLLSSSLALSMAVTRPQATADMQALAERTEQAWRLAHAAGYDELIPLLTDLIPAVEGAVRASRGAAQRAANKVLARLYHASAAALVKLGELAAAWVAVDRAIGAAERAGDRLLMGEGAFRLTLVFQACRQYDQAEHAAATAVTALAPLVDEGVVGAMSLQGALRLQLAVIAARQNHADEAYAFLRAARVMADQLGVDRNDYNTEFGPTNVALHQVAVAVELGDAGAALRAAALIDAAGLSAERQARLLIDVARAQVQRRNAEAAIRALVDAERITPEQTRHHWMVPNLLQDLDRAGHGRDPRVRGLIERYRVTTA